MKKIYHIILLISLFVLTFLVLDFTSYANDINFSGLFESLDEDLSKFFRWAGNRILGLIVVIVIEAILYVQLLKIPNSNAIWLSIFVNLLSASIGLCIAFISRFMTVGPHVTFLLPTLFAMIFGVILFIRSRPPAWFNYAALGAILIGGPGAFGVIALIRGEPPSFESINWRDPYFVYINLSVFILGFGTTLLTESIILTLAFRKILERWGADTYSIWETVFKVNCISYLVMIPFILHIPAFRTFPG